MQLYFLRHAIAVEPSDFDEDSDSKRPLAAEGVKRMKQAAKGMKKLGLQFDDIVSSPYLRAKQTAEIAAKGILHKRAIHFSDKIVPNASFKEFTQLLKEYRDSERLLVVGHQPSIGKFLGRLIADEGAEIDFGKGSLAFADLAIVGDPYKAELKWFLRNAQLRNLA